MAGAKSQADQLQNFLQKSLHAGQLYTLADGLNLTEADLDAWFPTFLAQYTEEEQVIIEKCRVLWTEDADEEREVRCGFPKSPADIKALFESGRLDAELFEPELSAAEMLIINAANATTALEFKEGTRTGADNKPVACPKCLVVGSCPGTCKVIIAVYDRVYDYIGRGIHTTAQVAIEKAELVRKCLQKYRTMMAKHIHPNLRDFFLSGRYRTWEDLKNAVRRAFGIKEEKVTIPDLFRQIDDVITAKRPVEQKMGKLVRILRKVAIKNKADFFTSADFEGDRIIMRHPEDPRGSPLVNTLLTLLMWKEIPKSKWEEMQLEFERRTDAGWSYKTWHTHRPTLYEIMDKQTPSSHVNAVEYEHTATAEPADNDINAVDRGNSRMNNRRQYAAANQRRGNAQPKQTRGVDSNPMPVAERRKQNAAAPQNRRNLCAHCTHYDPFRRAVYHPDGAGFGGMGKCCLFDKEGAERKDSYGRGVNDIAFSATEAEGYVRAIIADIPLVDADNTVADPESAAWNMVDPNTNP